MITYWLKTDLGAFDFLSDTLYDSAETIVLVVTFATLAISWARKAPPTVSSGKSFPANGSEAPNIEDRLRQLDELKSKGLISEIEYNAKRADILRQL
ncbi:MAG TPA: SHOCT domain-containing protein [Terricaulis sp.]|nr:SHOCT domain-containing protein [Terricaulis sp.]